MTRPLRLTLIFLLATACSGPASEPARPAETRPAPGFTLDYDPASGRGRITQVLPNGDRYDLCLQCRYPGYAGGLWIGNQDGSGFEFTPAAPRRGFKRLNIFCAQDESLRFPETGTEWSNGWSENFGSGADGEKLHYMEGAVLEPGPERAILRSVNRGGCVEETRFLLWRAGTRHVIFAAHLKNICDIPIRFDFFSGDDPWIGRYKSSEGDVGWTPTGVIRRETELEGETLAAVGMMDLGNALLGETGAPYSGEANAMMLPPGQEPPTRAFVANRFAHEPGEIDPDRPLDNRTMTAFNLGWTDRRLAPGQSWRVAYALAHVPGDGTGDPPPLPEIPTADWRFDSAFLPEPQGTPSKGPLEFLGETIRLDLDPPDLRVTGRYTLRNARGGTLKTGILYPFPVDATHPYPEEIEVEGYDFTREKEGIRFALSLGPHETRSITIRYRQRSRDPSARYILTTTAVWGSPLRWGHYQATWPATLPEVSVSMEGNRKRKGDRIVWSAQRLDFLPEKDFSLTWK